ncbi:MAG TPA: SH3 domain-containing protein [Gemmatimonadales bacterium]
MPDIECPRCGAHALGVATRCPRCGEAFPAELVQRPPLRPVRGWGRPLLVLAGAAAVLLAFLAVMRERDGSGEPTAEPTPRVEETAEPAGATVPPADSVPAEPQASPPPAPSATPSPQTAPPAAAPPAATPSAGASLRRYATTWVHLRAGRSMDAPVVRVLDPGEPVAADSLRRGWYRVVATDSTVGYVHRRYLAVSP